MDTDTKKLAAALLTRAETDLRALVGAAANAGEYENVAGLTDIARRVGLLIKNITNNDDSVPAGNSVSPSTPQSKTPQAPRRLVFPRFVVAEDKLVKIGWSKKEKSTYEHKAAKQDVELICDSLSNRAGKSPFRMEEMLPIVMTDGSTVPSYQAYLTLAWLRDLGLVEKAGNNGYRWSKDPTDVNPFEMAWQATISKS